MKLYELVRARAQASPGALAVSGPDGDMTYGELDQAADALAHALLRRGVRRGDRVALWLPKSAGMVAAMQSVLRIGAVYVPVDPLSPVARAVRVLQDCDPVVVICSAQLAEQLGAAGIEAVLRYPGETQDTPAHPVPDPGGSPDDPAYILYTSGSTGRPKGVCLSHRNALAFIEWAAHEIAASETDRFAGHAPFHFDLSVLDLYVAFSAGASVHLIPAELSFSPRALVDFAINQQVTVWYSVPSALIMMMRDGNMLDENAARVALRAVLFAGEPFPPKHLRRFRNRFQDIRLLNLYGPTETNVCTFYEVRDVPEHQVHPVPIGRACSGDRVWAVRDDGTATAPGEEGELIVDGPSVMLGYWGKIPPGGSSPYRTGDRVLMLESGDYHYLGRLDDMVKIRGHRVELGEITAALQAHPDVSDVAVVLAGTGIEARLVAYIVPAGPRRPGLLDIKQHCAAILPRYMIVDAVRYVNDLPRTGTGKVDRRSLAAGRAAVS
jgi:amino acid adenylation domain-containing protein